MRHRAISAQGYFSGTAAAGLGRAPPAHGASGSWETPRDPGDQMLPVRRGAAGAFLGCIHQWLWTVPSPSTAVRCLTLPAGDGTAGSGDLSRGRWGKTTGHRAKVGLAVWVQRSSSSSVGSRGSQQRAPGAGLGHFLFLGEFDGGFWGVRLSACVRDPVGLKQERLQTRFTGCHGNGRELQLLKMY